MDSNEEQSAAGGPRRQQDLEAAYVLHHRPYRDTSRILDVLTVKHGRITLFARGARGPKSKWAPLLMPFRPLLVAWRGRGDAAQLTAAESIGEPRDLPPASLMSAFYLNELVIRLTTRHDPQPQLFADYSQALDALRASDALEPVLRIFEKRLLAALGYGLELDVDARQHYQFTVDRGFLPVSQDARGAISGVSLRALAAESLQDRTALDDARRLLRLALDQCLEGRELATRSVARAVARQENLQSARVERKPVS